MWPTPVAQRRFLLGAAFEIIPGDGVELLLREGGEVHHVDGLRQGIVEGRQLRRRSSSPGLRAEDAGGSVELHQLL